MGLVRAFGADKLKVEIYDSRLSMGQAAAAKAADAIQKALEKKSHINIIFAAAPSQNEFLQALRENAAVDWTKINAFHMDEYIGLEKDAPQGFGNFLKERLFGKVPFRRVYYIDGQNRDVKAECKRYEKLLTENPPDLVFMGIGENGHIAFNDPHVAFFNDPERVKVVELDEKCRTQQVNDGCFQALEQVPTHAITLTIPALTEAEEIFCVVPGPTKAVAVQATVKGPVSEVCPASILRRHPNACLYLDTDSAKLL